MDNYDTSFTDELFGNSQPGYGGYNGFVQQPVRPKTDNGIIWYICILPLLALFLENYASSKWAGIFLWTAAVVMLIFSCCYDCKKLEKSGLDTTAVRGWVWLAPVYVFRREKMLGRETYKGIMLTVFCLAALSMNGFVQGMSVNEDSLPEIVANSYVQNLDNFSGVSSNIIGEQLEEYLGEDIDWDCTKKGDIYTLTCTGKHDDKEVVVAFEVKHDGFAFLGCRVSEIRSAGESLEDEDFKNALLEIMIPEALEEKDAENAETQKA